MRLGDSVSRWQGRDTGITVLAHDASSVTGARDTYSPVPLIRRVRVQHVTNAVDPTQADPSISLATASTLSCRRSVCAT